MEKMIAQSTALSDEFRMSRCFGVLFQLKVMQYHIFETILNLELTSLDLLS